MHTNNHTPLVRNETMDCFKLLASFFVVLIHCPFPDPLGSMLISLARFAVPVFFAISGYFSYGVRPGKLVRRLIHIGKLYVLAVVLCAVAGAVVQLGTGQDLAGYLWGFVPGTENLSTILLLHMSFFPGTEHAWYLVSVGFCYLILSLYAGFFAEEPVNYKPLYHIAVVLLILNLLMGEMALAAAASVPYKLYRNGLFTGLPMFTLGIFIREYSQRIMNSYRLNDKKLLGIVFLGVILTVIQWKGIGTCELPIGILPQVVAWMLLLVSHPVITVGSQTLRRFLMGLKDVSTTVYLIHVPLIAIYDAFVLPRFPAGFAAAECWLRPFVIFLLSALIGVIFNLLSGKQKRK